MASSSKSKPYTRICLAYTISLTLLLISYAVSDSAEEMQKCAEQLEGVTTCLPYVGGDAKAPTPDCCSGLKEAVKNNHRCLCLVVKDRNDPDLGFKINITLALGLPYICKAPENLSECPALLHLDPNSPEAQVFNQVHRTFTGASSPAFSPTTAESSPEEGRTGNSGKNEASYCKKIMLKPGILIAGLLIWLS